LGNLMKSLSPRRPSASNRKRRISKLKEEQSLGCSSLMSTSSGTSTAAADAAWRVGKSCTVVTESFVHPSLC